MRSSSPWCCCWFKKADLTAQRTLEELRRIAFFDIGELFDGRGQLKNIKTLPPEVRSAIASTEVVRMNMISGDGKREWLHKVRAVDKMQALEILAKHFRLLDDHLEISGSVDVEMKFKALDEGRARNGREDGCPGSASRNDRFRGGYWSASEGVTRGRAAIKLRSRGRTCRPGFQAAPSVSRGSRIFHD